jgi:hypothetical protein
MPKRLRRIIYSFRSVFITENKSSCTVLFVALKYTKNVCGQVSARTPLGKRHLVSFLAFGIRRLDAFVASAGATHDGARISGVSRGQSRNRCLLLPKNYVHACLRFFK